MVSPAQRERQKQFGLRLQDLMHLRSVTRAELAAIAGISVNMIGAICRGEVLSISVLTALKIADHLGCEVRWLATGEGKWEVSKTSKKSR